MQQPDKMQIVREIYTLLDITEQEELKELIS